MMFIWSKIQGYVIAAIGFIGLLFGIYYSGKRAAKTDVDKVRLKTKIEADEIDDAIAGRDIQKNRDELGRWSK